MSTSAREALERQEIAGLADRPGDVGDVRLAHDAHADIAAMNSASFA